MRGGRDEENWMSDQAGVSRRLVQDADSRHVRATTPSSRQQSTRRRRRRVCPPQGLTALKPCLETPATPQTRHVCAHCRRPGRAKHAIKPRVECRRRRRRLCDASSSAVDAASPCGMQWRKGGREISSWYVLVDLSQTATCVWLASRLGVETVRVQVIRWTRDLRGPLVRLRSILCLL